MQQMWEFRANLYDLLEASDLRRREEKRMLFSQISGRTLFLAVGTGLDIRHLPPLGDVVAIDISEQMLRKARERVRAYDGLIRLLRADAEMLPFADAAFQTLVTSCTMCSVPRPDVAFREFYRVLRPGGVLLMFEHVRSENSLLGWMLDVMTMWTRLTGTDMNRRTLVAATKAGFVLQRVESVYLDIILAVRAAKPGTRKGDRAAIVL